MNTFDKASLFQLSYALMRRFAFIEVQPPPPTDFEKLLRARAQGWQEAKYKQLETVIALFCRDDGLRATGLPIGPAIALDVVSTLGLSQSTSQEAVTEAVEMYLFPQFEGRSNQHDVLVKAIASTLELSESARNGLSRKLGEWTGLL